MDIWLWSKQKLADNEKAANELEVKLQGETAAVSTDSSVAEVKRRHESHIVICGRKKSVKDISHLWELGGGTVLPALFAVPITEKNIEITSMFIFVDLTNLQSVWSTIETLIDSARRRLDELARNPAVRQVLELRKKWKLSSYDKDDAGMCEIFPLNLTIVAAKYDEFQNFEPDKRRSMCAFLRFISHYYGANLMMYSSKMDQFGKIVKNVMSHFAFATTWPQGKVNDFTKPLFIRATTDSFMDIGMPPGDVGSLSATNPFNLWKDAFQSVFPKREKNEENEEKDPMNDPLFAEVTIDELVEMKRKEMENEKRQKRERDAAEQRASEKISKMAA